MTKIVYKSLKSGQSGARAVGKKRVAVPGGGWKTIRTLDANSPSFDDDLQYVFARNVAKARRENKRLLGSADGGNHKA